jgi:hypothetical protein
MAQCPTCHNEVKPDERFCGNCGARLEPPLPNPEAARPTERLPGSAPERPLTGKETVVLTALTDPDLRPPPEPGAPTADATIISAPAVEAPRMDAGSSAVPGGGATLPSRQPIEPTIVGMPPAGTPGQIPPSSTPPGMPAGTIPSGVAAPAPKSGGNTIWKILAVVAAIAVLACVAAAAGIWFLTRQLSSATENVFATVNAGLEDGSVGTAFANIATTVAEPTPGLPSTGAGGTSAGVGGTSSGTTTGAVLFSDEFENADTSAFSADETNSAAYAFTGGAFEISVKKPNLIVWDVLRGQYGDASVAVDTTIVQGKQTAAGLIFHLQDDDNFYIYTITDDGRYGLDVYKDGKGQILIDWTESPAIHPPGEVNRLRVETTGSRIRLYANDELLDEISDATFVRGKAAFVVNRFVGAGSSATFDNLVVREIKER